MRFFVLFALAMLALVPVGCSSTPKSAAKKEPEKPLDPITGRHAFQQIFPAARGWAPDAKPLQLESYNLPAIKSESGKAGAWQVIFVSDVLHKSKPYTWSAIEAPGNLHLGVFAGLDGDWSGRAGQSMPFAIEAIRVDSDAALETALKDHQTQEFVKKFPDEPVKFLLERTKRFPDLTWRVLWGQTVGSSKFSVFVDASTGQFLEAIH